MPTHVLPMKWHTGWIVRMLAQHTTAQSKPHMPHQKLRACLRRCQVALQAAALGGRGGCIRFGGSQLGTGCSVLINLLRQAVSLRSNTHVKGYKISRT